MLKQKGKNLRNKSNDISTPFSSPVTSRPHKYARKVPESKETNILSPPMSRNSCLSHKRTPVRNEATSINLESSIEESPPSTPSKTTFKSPKPPIRFNSPYLTSSSTPTRNWNPSQDYSRDILWDNVSPRNHIYSRLSEENNKEGVIKELCNTWNHNTDQNLTASSPSQAEILKIWMSRPNPSTQQNSNKPTIPLDNNKTFIKPTGLIFKDINNLIEITKKETNNESTIASPKNILQVPTTSIDVSDVNTSLDNLWDNSDDDLLLKIIDPSQETTNLDVGDSRNMVSSREGEKINGFKIVSECLNKHEKIKDDFDDLLDFDDDFSISMFLSQDVLKIADQKSDEKVTETKRIISKDENIRKKCSSTQIAKKREEALKRRKLKYKLF